MGNSMMSTTPRSERLESQAASAVPSVTARAIPRDSVPKPILIATACLLVLTMVFAFVARRTDIGATRLVPPPAVETLNFAAEKADNGDIALVNAESGKSIVVLPAKSDGFLKIVLRTVEQRRTLAEVSTDGSVRLSRLTNGQLTLTDDTTGQIILLSAFGASNAGVFADLLDR